MRLLSSLLSLLLPILTLMSCSDEKTGTGFAGSWSGNVLINGQPYEGTLSIIPMNETAFSGNLMLRQQGNLVNSVPINGTIMGEQATGQTVEVKPVTVTLTLADKLITAVFKNAESSFTATFNQHTDTPGSYPPPQPTPPTPSVESQGHDPNLSAVNWMTKESTTNTLTKRFKKLLPDGSIDGYKITFFPSAGQYDNPQPEPDETIERWKQQGVRWYTTGNSTFCMTLPEGLQCFNYQINGDDLNFYNNEGQLVERWMVPY